MNCQTCKSKAPHLHHAVQFECEIELCTDDYHLQHTPSNKQEYIDSVLAKRAALAKEKKYGRL